MTDVVSYFTNTEKSQQDPNLGYKYLLNKIYAIVICEH